MQLSGGREGTRWLLPLCAKKEEVWAAMQEWQELGETVGADCAAFESGMPA
jgi:hypothetical protein